MTIAAAPRVPTLAVGPVSCASVLWRESGQMRVTAVVKATFAFSSEPLLRLTSPEPIHSAEVHRKNNPSRSIVSASDLSPVIPRAEVVLTGHAWSPRGAPQTRVVVRLVIARGRAVVLEKTLHAAGDRDGGSLVPFQKMPLTYERALGGIGNQQNPLGVGAGSSTQTPNIEDPRDATISASFAPISRSFPARRKLLTPEQRKLIDQPVIEIPDRFDWSYFQSSPPDQRIDALYGDETIAIDGVHADVGRLTGTLPNVSACARIHGLGLADQEIVPLRATTLAIDADAMTCSVTFRESVPIAAGRSLDAIRIAGAISLGGAPIAWAEGHESGLSIGSSTTTVGQTGTVVLEDAPEPGAKNFEQTRVLSPGEQSIARAHDELPFATTGEQARTSDPGPPIPGAPWSDTPAVAPALTISMDRTLTTDPEPPLFVAPPTIMAPPPVVLAPPAPAPESQREPAEAPAPAPVVIETKAPEPAPPPDAPAPPPVAADPWAKPPPPEAAPVPTPSVQKPAKKPGANLYGKFGKR